MPEAAPYILGSKSGPAQFELLQGGTAKLKFPGDGQMYGSGSQGSGKG